jgi:imidazole glycerol-phosphate synthase subunit HisF
MHLKRVIPCLDVDNGRVVKGIEFVDIRDAGDPVELAAHYDREGADELVFLDITATHERRDTIVQLARRTADEVFVPFTIGGGIRSVEDAQAVLDAGADKVSINSAALARPQLIDELARVFGTQCVVLAVDAKADPATVDPKARPPAAEAAVTARAIAHEAAPTATGDRISPGPGPSRASPSSSSSSWEAYIAGGRKPAGRDVIEWVREAVERGAGEILLTSMDRDGTSDGYDLALTRAVGEAVAVPVIASGGAGELEHLAQALHAGADAALCASIFHYGQHTVGEAKAYLNEAGIPVRTG